MLKLCLFIGILLPTIAAAQLYDGRFTSFLGFELNKTNLGEIKESFGEAPLLESGDAGEYEAKICYIGNVGTIYFISGEMGRPDHELLGFEISEKEPGDEKLCSPLPEQLASSRLKISGLYLGMTKKEFESVTGKGFLKKTNSGGWYLLEYTIPMTKKEIAKIPPEDTYQFWDVSLGLKPTFKEGHMSKLRVYQTQSN